MPDESIRVWPPVTDAHIAALKMAWRNVLRRPTLAISSVVLLSLGIGVNLALYSVLRMYYFRPPSGVQRPDEIFVPELWNRQRGQSTGFTREDLRALRTSCTMCTAVEAHTSGSVTATFADESERLSVQFTTDGYFDALGVRAELGEVPHAFANSHSPEDTWVVVSHTWWVTHLGSDPRIVGRSVRIGQLFARVLGVVPHGFVGLLRGTNVQAWVPERQRRALQNELPGPLDDSRDRSLAIFVRSQRAGITGEMQSALLRLTQAQIAAGYVQPGELRAHIRGVAPGVGELRSQGVLTVVVFAFSFALVMVVLTCLNLAQMALARTLSRQHQIAVELSLGAGIRQIALPIIFEQAIIALAGGTIGLLTSWWVLSSLLNRVDSDMRTAPDLATLCAAFSIAVVTIGIVSVAPALKASRTSLAMVLRKTPGTGGVWGAKSRRLFVGAQVTLAAALLSCAAAFARSAQLLGEMPLGFVASERVMVAGLDLSAEDKHDFTLGRRWQQAVSAIHGERGVGLVALAERLPGARSTPVAFGMRAQGAHQEILMAARMAITGDYFGVLHVPVLAGTGFGNEASFDGERVAVVSASVAQRMGGVVNALGSLVQEGDAGGPWSRVIGVVADTRPPRSGEVSWPVVYLPATQTLSLADAAYLVAELGGEGATQPMTTALRHGLRRAAPRGVLYDERTLSAYVDASLANQRFGAILLGALGVLSLAIAAAGCYGTASFVASQRLREAGIRAALGASKSKLLTGFMADGLFTAMTGATAGVIAAVLLVRVLASQIDGLSGVEWMVFAAIGCVTVLIAGLSALRPNWTVASTEPATALRAE